MSSDTFFSKNTSINFVVQNLLPNKRIKVFNYPINPGQTRDLLAIPEISESDIRHSLIKGELANFIRRGIIQVISSSIDLLQFDSEQKDFLQDAGVVDGLDPVSSGSLTAGEHETLRQIIHFIDEGPGDGFASGAYKTTTPAGNPFPTLITWYANATQTQKIVEKDIVWAGVVPATITWKVYDIDGVTVTHTVTDNISYVNTVFETNRIRTIS